MYRFMPSSATGDAASAPDTEIGGRDGAEPGADDDQPVPETGGDDAAESNVNPGNGADDEGPAAQTAPSPTAAGSQWLATAVGLVEKCVIPSDLEIDPQVTSCRVRVAFILVNYGVCT